MIKLLQGIEPWTLRLLSVCSTTKLKEQKLLSGIEPETSSLQDWCSTTKLKKHYLTTIIRFSMQIFIGVYTYTYVNNSLYCLFFIFFVYNNVHFTQQCLNGLTHAMKSENGINPHDQTLNTIFDLFFKKLILHDSTNNPPFAYTP